MKTQKWYHMTTSDGQC